MSVSTRSIIAHINEFPGSFTRDDLIKKITSGRLYEKRQSRRKKTHTRQDAALIDETLDVLRAIGFLEKRRKSYSRSPDFSCNGTISIDQRGRGVIVTHEGDEFLVKKNHTGHAHSNDEVYAELHAFRRGYFYARVTGVAKRRRDRIIARIEHVSRKNIYLRLVDLPGIIEVCSPVLSDQPPDGHLAVVSLTGKTREGIPECSIIESFSPEDDTSDFKRISVRHSLPGEHPVYDELKKYNQKFIGNEKKSRRDFRSLYTITIDGENAKDFDDAISLERDGDNYRLFVHIADVSTFVDKGGEIDREAGKRATSFYLGSRVIPMLPEMLSNDLCSLKEGVERLSLTAEIIINFSGKTIESFYHRGIIKSNKRLTYTGAHEIIEKKRSTKLGGLLNEMYELAVILKNNRMQSGRVDLNLTDPEFIYEGNALIDLVAASRLKSHMIIEEFMLTANEAVSRTLRENNIPGLYRIHEAISEEKLVSLNKFLFSLGIRLNSKIPVGNALQDVIEQVRDREYEEVVNFIVLKSFMQAYYGVHPKGHFGLGFRDYTHFTSPIRRYPDLIVHRCIQSMIKGIDAPYTTEELIPIGEKSSEMERTAQSAERDLYKLNACRLMAGRVGESFDAVISGIGKAGFFITLLEKPIEGMVPLRVLTDDYYLIQEDEYTVIGKRLGRRFRLGDRVRVKLINVEVETMRIDFDVIS